MKAVNQTPSKIVSDREEQRVCESEDSVQIPFQILTISTVILRDGWGPRWQSGNTLASHLCGWGSIPVMAVSGKAGSCLPLVGSLQYRTLANYMYWFPLPFQLPVVI